MGPSAAVWVKIRNMLAAIVFSDTEIFSNLELTQVVYDQLLGNNDELDFPLSDGVVLKAVQSATDQLLRELVSRTPIVVRGAALQQVREETIALFRNGDTVKTFLGEVESGYPVTNK